MKLYMHPVSTTSRPVMMFRAELIAIGDLIRVN